MASIGSEVDVANSQVLVVARKVRLQELTGSVNSLFCGELAASQCLQPDGELSWKQNEKRKRGRRRMEKR